jgi:hypothetical protein
MKMFRSRYPAIAAFVVGSLFPATAFAQSAPASSRVGSGRPSIGIFGMFDRTMIASRQSFDAVFDTHTTSSLGGGVDVVNLWKGVFLRVDGASSTLTGERVVVFNGDVFALGIPLTVTLRPIEVGGGWRLASNDPRARFSPYAGVSAIILKYTETSDFADAGENVDESYTGVGVFGGVDVRLVKQVFAGVEAQYRSITSAPGPDSVAASFNEKNLGGTVLRVRFGIRF